MNYAADLAAIANGEDLSERLEKFAEDVASSCFHRFVIMDTDLLYDMMQEARLAIVELSGQNHGPRVGGGLLRTCIYRRIINWLKKDARQRQAYGWDQATLEDWGEECADDPLLEATAREATARERWVASNVWDNIVRAYEDGT